MDRIDRAVFLGLAALTEIADQSNDGPVAPTLQIRALLALVALQSNGDLRSYTGFWQRIQDKGRPGQHASGVNYERQLHAHIDVLGIAKSVGIRPQAKAYTDAITAVLRRK